MIICNQNSYAISLIVNKTVLESSFSSKETRDIFTLQKSYWKNGKRIRVFVLPDQNPLHQKFSKTITKIFPHQFRRIWDRLTFSGTGIAPTTVNTIEEMILKVSQTLYSIGYIDQQSIPTPISKLIRVIDLKMPEEKSHE